MGGQVGRSARPHAGSRALTPAGRREAVLQARVRMPTYSATRWTWNKHCRGWLQQPLGMLVGLLLLALIIGVTYLLWTLFGSKVKAWVKGYMPVSTVAHEE